MRACALIQIEKTGCGGATSVIELRGRARLRRSRACFVDEIQSPEVNLTEFDRS